MVYLYVCAHACIHVVHLGLHQSLRAAGACVGEKSIEVLRISEQRHQGLCWQSAHWRRGGGRRGAGKISTTDTYRSNRNPADRPVHDTNQPGRQGRRRDRNTVRERGEVKETHEQAGRQDNSGQYIKTGQKYRQGARPPQ